MSTLDLVHKLLGALKDLPADRWICSVDTVRKGPVKEHDVGLRDGTTAWSRWKFGIDGHDHDLEIERNGTATRVILDGTELGQPKVDIHGTTHGLSIVTVVRCTYRKADGSAGEYRFDGKNASLFG